MKRIKLSLKKRGVSAIARLMEVEAPKTSAAIWKVLPKSGELFHARWSGFQIYHLMEELLPDPGPENTTITPQKGDLVYLRIPSGWISARELAEIGFAGAEAIGEIAVFYDRNSLIIGGALGVVPGNVFASIEEGLDEWHAASIDIWLNGRAGETIVFERIE